MKAPDQRWGNRQRFRGAASVILLMTAHVACRQEPPEPPPFVPPWPLARQSLELSLAAWREAVATASIPVIPGVQFVDRKRKPNQKLIAFQILGQSEIENARQFTVRLNLEGEEAPQLVKYNVVGRDPVWVFRLDDYEMFAHWEHEMSAPTETRETASAAGQAPKSAPAASRPARDPE